MQTKMFPILGNYVKEGEVPWDFVAPHEAQAKRNHDQSLERLAERGGLSWLELYAVLTGRRFWDIRSLSAEQAKIAVYALLMRYKQQKAGTDD